MPYGITAPTINPNTFPYLKKFTREELDDLLERIDQIRYALNDMVGPSGVTMYIDAGTIANIAFHLAMVGGRVIDDEKAYLWPDVQPDQEGVFEGLIEWRLKKEHEQPPKPAAPPADPEEVERKAAAARELIRKQLAPEVEQALIKQLAVEFKKDATDQKDGDK